MADNRLPAIKIKLGSPAQAQNIAANGAPAKRESVAIVVPVFNEAANLPVLWSRLQGVLADPSREWEVVFVDDGSTDRSLEILREYSQQDDRVRVVELARNFGQHSALLAGFRNCHADVIVTLDADLQNPPEEIPKLLRAIAEGNDVVGGWREERQDRPYRRLA